MVSGRPLQGIVVPPLTGVPKAAAIPTVHKAGNARSRLKFEAARPQSSDGAMLDLFGDAAAVEMVAVGGVATMHVAGLQVEENAHVWESSLASIAPVNRPVQGTQSNNRVSLVSVPVGDHRRAIWAESRLESTQYRDLLWRWDVAEVMSQAMLVRFRNPVDGNYIEAFPDALVTTSDDRRALIDVKPTETWDERFAMKCHLLSLWCASIGLPYSVMSEVPKQRAMNLHALYMARDVQLSTQHQVDAVVAAVDREMSLGGLLRRLGDARMTPRPLLHCMWHNRIGFHINKPLGLESRVWPGRPPIAAQSFTHSSQEVLDFIFGCAGVTP